MRKRRIVFIVRVVIPLTVFALWRTVDALLAKGKTCVVQVGKRKAARITIA